MRKIAIVLLIAAAAPVAAKGGHSSGGYSTGSHAVRGYVTKSGTYVAPHHATNPNDTKLDNWTTKGNVNPYTGKPGTVDPYATTTANPTGSPYNYGK